MLKKFSFLFLFVLIFMNFCMPGYGETKGNPDYIRLFEKVARELKSLTTISYQYTQEFSYPSENYHLKSGGVMYVDFGRENDLVGFKYQYKTADEFSIFNNTSLLKGDIRKKTISTTKLQKSSFEGQTALYNSIITLRNVLPLIITDTSIVKGLSDTLINKKKFYMLTFESHNKLPNYLGTGFTATTKELTFYNKLIVDESTLLPVIMLQNTRGSADLNRTDFTKIHINPPPPEETSWYYSSYLNSYHPEKKSSITILKPGTIAPELSLKNYSNGSQETLSKYRGRLILLEFWIKNCGHCIEAVSELNDLSKRYTADTFQIFAINTEDSDESIKSFINKNQVNYTVLWGDDKLVNANYGIAAFPKVVLIDKAGQVIYSGDLNVQKITPFIEKNL
ncbi:TlpA disulfide reductase family protein [Pedobacter sp. L105]|uniref:TlpA family protein disulfide reductase n=1 Tax=Pedobacter sp. L105 TaxID=1641871 RepID=UPI00131A64EF|nr:TlpA disulfide reductase family protein [Pedobacter sp. L105]